MCQVLLSVRATSVAEPDVRACVGSDIAAWVDDRVLTAILLGEEQRLQKVRSCLCPCSRSTRHHPRRLPDIGMPAQSVFGGMLSSTNFHRQLLSCCAQTIVYVFKVRECASRVLVGCDWY